MLVWGKKPIFLESLASLTRCDYETEREKEKERKGKEGDVIPCSPQVIE